MPKKSKFEYPVTTKVLSTNTIRIYKTKIKRLSTSTNYTTVQEFLDNPKDVIMNFIALGVISEIDNYYLLVLPSNGI